MKLFFNLIPLLLVILGILNYMFLTKGVGLTAVLFAVGVVIAIYNIIKKQHILTAALSIIIVIASVALFLYLVNAGV
ncbi:hypothetical protein [Lentibacillus cibarius]|uniref:Uncharacterized protein n=1 Tax=Lentibacillus cibarius TaxID=2583219 RepID=A0A5S3QLJ9_9BACI|nr:hypothetical protein [Lentibacillus cibarius]TMN22101.1 hypothetical protein FFL34_08165 [Lentibacillus cibarius]